MHRNRITKLFDNNHVPARALARYKVSSSLEERLYATTDANHNVTSIDDVFGAAQERLVYDPYRQSTVLSAAWASTADLLAWSTRSQGEREDATTNTIDGRSRLYGIGMGRWMQADFAGYIDGANRYQFVKSNPIGYSDAFGFAAGAENQVNVIKKKLIGDDTILDPKSERKEWVKVGDPESLAKGSVVLKLGATNGRSQTVTTEQQVKASVGIEALGDTFDINLKKTISNKEKTDFNNSSVGTRGITFNAIIQQYENEDQQKRFDAFRYQVTLQVPNSLNQADQTAGWHDALETEFAAAPFIEVPGKKIGNKNGCTCMSKQYIC